MHALRRLRSQQSSRRYQRVISWYLETSVTIVPMRVFLHSCQDGDRPPSHHIAAGLYSQCCHQRFLDSLHVFVSRTLDHYKRKY